MRTKKEDVDETATNLSKRNKTVRILEIFIIILNASLLIVNPYLIFALLDMFSSQQGSAHLLLRILAVLWIVFSLLFFFVNTMRPRTSLYYLAIFTGFNVFLISFYLINFTDKLQLIAPFLLVSAAIVILLLSLIKKEELVQTWADANKTFTIQASDSLTETEPPKHSNNPYFDKLKTSLLDNKLIAWILLGSVTISGILSFGEKIIHFSASAFQTSNSIEDDIATRKIRPLYFQMLSAELTEQSKKQLEIVASILKAADIEKILVEGHTREIDPLSNVPLSMKRALAVEWYLTKKLGIDKSKIEWIAYGAEKPMKKETSGYNDRVEIQIFRK